MGKLLNILLFFLSFQVLGAEEFYDRPKLADMPLFEQYRFTKLFKEHSLERAFIGNQGSRILGVNLLFTDAFFSSTVAVKFDIKGKFTANKIYRFKNINAYHFSYKGKWTALYFENTPAKVILKIAKSLQERDLPRNEGSSSIFKQVSFIQTAYAEESCAVRDIGAKVDIDTGVGSMALGGFVSRCLDGLGSGVEDSTVGVLEEAGNLIKKGASFIGDEAKLFFNDPSARMGDYANFVGEGIGKLKEFTVAIGSMIEDPSYGAHILGKKFGEIGSFFSDAYQSVKAMPLEAKVDIVCNLIGAIGTDVLITALTVGATSGKLGFTVARLLFKLKKVARLIGKGLALPFKTMSKLGERNLARLERIIESGNEHLFRKKVKGMGCAI